MADNHDDVRADERTDVDEVVITPVSDGELDLFEPDDAIGGADVVVIDESETTETTHPVRVETGVLISDGSSDREVAQLDVDGPGHTVVVECPGCGLLCEGVDPRPTAAWFCPNCDYPLFLAAPAPAAVTTNTALARRRLPGTDGREMLGIETRVDEVDPHPPSQIGQYRQRCHR